jgi:hypothetical protein
LHGINIVRQFIIYQKDKYKKLKNQHFINKQHDRLNYHYQRNGFNIRLNLFVNT